MAQDDQHLDENLESRLSDEIEQLRTALEASLEEMARLAEDRDRLLRRVTEQSRELQSVNAAYRKAAFKDELAGAGATDAMIRHDQDQEELRVAFEEMQVLTEELESANDSLRQNNAALDRRVEERTEELAAKNLELLESEARFRTLVEGIPQLVWRSKDAGQWTWCSPQWTAFTGLAMEDSLGLGWIQALHPDDREAAIRFWADAERSGSLETEARIHQAAAKEYRWFKTRATPVRDAAGEIIEWLGTSTDVDELRAMQERQEIMVAELQHRTRNLIAVIRSVGQQTIDSSEDLEDFREAFNERLTALSRVQGLLSRADRERITIGRLLWTELDALGASGLDHVSLIGPEVPLRNSIVQTLALALHELATNARKYGALSDAGGRLDVQWHVRADDSSGARLQLAWTESGVRMPETRSRAARGGGYGRELIEKALPYSLGASTRYELTADGVSCEIMLPLESRRG